MCKAVQIIPTWKGAFEFPTTPSCVWYPESMVPSSVKQGYLNTSSTFDVIGLCMLKKAFLKLVKRSKIKYVQQLLVCWWLSKLVLSIGGITPPVPSAL